MPTLLQYPLERERDVQRRWKHLLQRTAHKEYPADTRKVSAFKAPSGRRCRSPRAARPRADLDQLILADSGRTARQQRVTEIKGPDASAVPGAIKHASDLLAAALAGLLAIFETGS